METNAISLETMTMNTCQSYGIFWDIENCPIPSNERASDIVKSIKDFIADKYESKVGQKTEPCTVICACDTKKLDERQVEALNRTGVDILHVNPIRSMNTFPSMAYKVDADSKLKECIQKYVEHHLNKKKCLLFVITGDIDFAPEIRAAKRRGFEVILLYGLNTSQEMKNSATEAHSYTDIIERNKCMFSEAINSKITIPFLTGGPQHIVNVPITPDAVNKATADALRRVTFSASAASSQSSSNTANNRSNPPFVEDVRNTVKKIENQNKIRLQNKQQKTSDQPSDDGKEYDPQKLKTIMELTNVDRHIALRVLQSTSGNVELAINLILSD